MFNFNNQVLYKKTVLQKIIVVDRGKTMKFAIIPLGLLFLFIILIADVENETNFKKTVCILRDKTFVTNYSCTAKAVNRHKTLINIYGHLAKRLDKIKLHLQLFKKFNNVVYRSFLVNVTEDFCGRFERKTNAPYLNILHSIAERFTNLNHTCPYEGWLIFKDFELDLSHLKFALPGGEYRFDIEPIVNNAPSAAFVLQFFFEFT